jgi:uncharacterized repeat protein (TIGR03803 family)
MKMKTKTLFILPALIAGLGFLATSRVTAQTFTTLYSFTANSANSWGAYTNSDGANPYAGLTVAGTTNTRYGTTSLGGSLGAGTVFAVNTDGTGFTNLHSFNYSDGATPWAGLILSGNTLYGTAYYGGGSTMNYDGGRGHGTVFAINTDGSGLRILHSFTETDAFGINGDGAYPNAGLILSGNTLYGTASRGGSLGSGTVFKVNTDGTRFTSLHSFTATDGADPVAGLILSGGTLYGTTAYGGSSGNGTLFKVNTDATGFTVLHSFPQTYQTGNGGGGGGGGGVIIIPPCTGFCGGA